MEAVARTKIKKSMTVYDLAITKMTVENDLRSDTELIKWSNEVDNCGNTVAYFKTANNKSCEFKTSDGVWWDISDIMNPIIALSIDDLHTAQAEGINGKTSFKLVVSFDRQSGAFRVDDLGYEKLKLEAQLALAPEEQHEDVQDNIEELELLFGFIDDKKDKNGGKENICIGRCNLDKTLNDIKTYPYCQGNIKQSCYTITGNTFTHYNYFDENGNLILSRDYYYGYFNMADEIQDYTDPRGLMIYLNCDRNYQNCEEALLSAKYNDKIYKIVYDGKGENITTPCFITGNYNETEVCREMGYTNCVQVHWENSDRNYRCSK